MHQAVLDARWKMSLFIVGAILPLGSLIWAGLLWYGLRQGKGQAAIQEMP